MAPKKGKRKASASPDSGGLGGSSGGAKEAAWSMEDAKEALLVVKLTLADEQGIRKVGKNSLAEAIHGSVTPGKVAWSNVMRRTCALPLAESSKFPLEGSTQKADVYHPSEVPAVVHKLLGVREGLAWFQNTSFVSDVKTLMTKCGSSDFSKLEAVVEAVQVQRQQRAAELAAFRLPALSEGFSQMRLHKNAQGRVLISAHDEIKWLGLDEDGKHNEWTHWLGSATEEYVKGYHNSSNPRNDDTPCMEHVKLDGERIPTPMFDKKCFQKVILLSIGKSKLAGEHAEKALDIYGRHIVGDSRLDEERAANAAAAPKEAKDFVLGSEEATRQERLRSEELVKTIRGEVSLELTVQLATLQQMMMARDDRIVARVGSQCEQLSLRAIHWATKLLDTSLASIRGNFKQSFQEVVSEARASGLIEITRQSMSERHIADQERLLKLRKQLPAGMDANQVLRDDGHLPVTNFLEEHLTLEDHYVIVHFMPKFAQELKRRKLCQAEALNEKPWIARAVGEWRIQYTERDRGLMQETFFETRWQDALRRQLVQHKPAEGLGGRRGHATHGGFRDGPYSSSTKVEQGGSSNITVSSLRSYFRV